MYPYQYYILSFCTTPGDVWDDGWPDHRDVVDGRHGDPDYGAGGDGDHVPGVVVWALQHAGGRGEGRRRHRHQRQG